MNKANKGIIYGKMKGEYFGDGRFSLSLSVFLLLVSFLLIFLWRMKIYIPWAVLVDFLWLLMDTIELGLTAGGIFIGITIWMFSVTTIRALILYGKGEPILHKEVLAKVIFGIAVLIPSILFFLSCLIYYKAIQIP